MMPLGNKKRNSKRITPHFVLRTIHYFKWGGGDVTFFMQPNGKEGLIKHKEQNAMGENYKNYRA